MNKLAFTALFAIGCAAGAPHQDASRLTAGADARHLGVYAYSVAKDVVTLFDQDGVELGQIGIDAASDDQRVFTLDLIDGTQDEAFVYRPMANGTFVAPIVPETVLTTSLADPALRSTWASYRVRFTQSDERMAAGIQTSDIANTGSCSAYNTLTPDGCARPANPNLGCTNPSQLPAAITSMPSWSWAADWSSSSQCNANKANDCASTYGGDLTDWDSADESSCIWNNVDLTYVSRCRVGTSANKWEASCPRSTCPTAGQYDKVPRINTCQSPGSCTGSQGTIGCTPYH